MENIVKCWASAATDKMGIEVKPATSLEKNKAGDKGDSLERKLLVEALIFNFL